LEISSIFYVVRCCFNQSTKYSEVFLQIPEVVEEINKKTYEVPNIIHFVYFGCLKAGVDAYQRLVNHIYLPIIDSSNIPFLQVIFLYQRV